MTQQLITHHFPEMSIDPSALQALRARIHRSDVAGTPSCISKSIDRRGEVEHVLSCSYPGRSIAYLAVEINGTQ